MGKQLCFTVICDNKLSGDLTNAKFVEYLFLTFCQFFLSKTRWCNTDSWYTDCSHSKIRANAINSCRTVFNIHIILPTRITENARTFFVQSYKIKLGWCTESQWIWKVRKTSKRQTPISPLNSSYLHYFSIFVTVLAKQCVLRT